MFNELNLMIELPKLFNKFDGLLGRYEFFLTDGKDLADDKLEKLYEEVNDLRDEVNRSNYDLILTSRNDLYCAYENLSDTLYIWFDELSSEMGKRDLFKSVRVLTAEEVEEWRKKTLKEDIERRQNFFINK